MLNLNAAAADVNELIRNPPGKSSPKVTATFTNFLAALNYHRAIGKNEAVLAAIEQAVDTTTPA